MFDRGEPTSREHPCVSAVEHVLAVAALRSAGRMPVRDGRAIAYRAVWLCACEAFDDAPTWLIYDIAEGKVDWCRVPDGIDIADLVDAPVVTGAHVSPEQVLRWLQDGEATTTPEGWPFDGLVIEDLGRKIRRLTRQFRPGA